MASIQRLGEQEAALSRQRGALARTQSLAFRRYKEGYSPYLEQLDAERSLLSSDLALVQNRRDRKSTRLNSQSLMRISYAVFCLKKKKLKTNMPSTSSPCI